MPASSTSNYWAFWSSRVVPDFVARFAVTSPVGLTVLTDPWRNDSTGLYPKWFLNEFPAIQVDIVLSTHAHFDHDAVERPKGLVVLERLVGKFKLGDIEITGLADAQV
jgi:L-ascorbate metabolism protein UlaG (beta-lactamase superfamily)